MNLRGKPLTLRADHVAGAAFIAFGILVFALSGDLPFGSLSSPGRRHDAEADGRPDDGVRRADRGQRRREPRFASIDWSDRGHALLLVLITAAAIALYQPLGFLITMTLLVFVLLVVVERRNVLIAAAYSIGLTLFAYWLFGKALKSPLERGLLWF